MIAYVWLVLFGCLAASWAGFGLQLWARRRRRREETWLRAQWRSRLPERRRRWYR